MPFAITIRDDNDPYRPEYDTPPLRRPRDARGPLPLPNRPGPGPDRPRPAAPDPDRAS